MTQRLVLFASVLTLLVILPARAELLDAVVATVDKEVILYSDLISEIGQEVDSLRLSVASHEEFQRRTDQLLKEALEEAIDSRLLVRESRKFPQLAVTDEELELVVAESRKLFQTQEEFVQAVGGSVSEFRERRRDQLTAQRMSSARLHSFEEEVVVSEREISEYYEEHLEEYERPERVFVRQIFLRARKDADRAQARAKLELLREEIRAGGDFDDLARLHSQAPGAEDGGIVGWQQHDDLIAPLEDAAFALSAGEVSDVVETRGGMHLIKIDEHEEAQTAPLDEVAPDIEPILRQQTAQEHFETWLNDIRRRSKVRVFL